GSLAAAQFVHSQTPGLATSGPPTSPYVLRFTTREELIDYLKQQAIARIKDFYDSESKPDAGLQFSPSVPVDLAGIAEDVVPGLIHKDNRVVSFGGAVDKNESNPNGTAKLPLSKTEYNALAYLEGCLLAGRYLGKTPRTVPMDWDSFRDRMNQDERNLGWV